MKNVLILTLLTFAISACHEETLVSHEEEPLKSETLEELFAARLEEAMKSNVKVEFTTFEELNHLFVSNGLEPLDEKRFNRPRTAREAPCSNTYDCQVWADLGDWNDDDKFNALDLYFLNVFRCGEGDCNGSYYTGNGDYSAAATDFGWMSLLCDSSAPWYLDDDDMETAIDFILGYISCT